MLNGEIMNNDKKNQVRKHGDQNINMGCIVVIIILALAALLYWMI
jgi:hypothetical protein